MSYPQQYSAQQASPQDSVGSWMLAVFLIGIPLVGLIYVLVVAFGGSSSPARRNWARAQLIWMLIVLALAIIGLVIATATGSLALSGFFSTYSR